MNRILFFVAMACLAADLSSLCFAQDHATGGNKLSRQEWQSRVNATRERLDQRREELRLEREKLLGPKQEELRLNRKERIEPKPDELRRERENKGGDFPPPPQVGSTIDPARFS
ncbi:hypothetical protein, partial [Bradyrhizobium sp. CW11]|uniref:hypothetical protein n=1 Tax=Bradyrhizobium sp. CW11 TaxID=2782684 RepID=UPI001FF82B35